MNEVQPWLLDATELEAFREEICLAFSEEEG